MMYHNLDELLDLITAKLDPEEILDILKMDVGDLVYKLRGEIEESAEDFERAVK